MYEEEEEEGEEELEEEDEDAQAQAQMQADEEAYSENFAYELVKNATDAGPDKNWDTAAIGRMIAMIAHTRGWDRKVSRLIHFLHTAKLPVLDTAFFDALNEQIIWLQVRKERMMMIDGMVCNE